MPTPHTLLFDLDGTLVDCSGAIIDATLHVTQIHGLEPPEPVREWARSRIGRPPRETWEQLGAPDPDAMMAAFGERVIPRMNERLIVLPGVPGALHDVHSAGHAMAVATTRNSGSARDSLAAAGLLNWFGQVSGRDLVERPKPAPDVLLHALAAVGGRADDALMIGDSAADVHAAHAAGMPCWGVLGGIGDEKELREAGADFILSGGLGELPAALRRASPDLLRSEDTRR
ncbi:MAG: phosphoglycolate phosphatase, bacterial [Planctomycetota bacterium]|nr:MAG: phosphoglycolate phosphatase, bacterial [Planctomycetota bacterium]